MKLVLSAVLVLCGCMSSVPYKPKTVKASPGVTDADLYASTIRIFDDMGLDTREKDKDAGIVASKFAHAGTIMTQNIWHAWRVRIEEGSLRVSIDCQMSEANSPVVNECGMEGRADDWVKMQPQLAAKILADASDRARKRREKETMDQQAVEAEKATTTAAPTPPKP